MANIQLLPGFGSRYTSESFASTDTVGADIIDTSCCAQFAIQVVKNVGTTPVGTVQIQESLDGVNWANLGLPLSIAAADSGSITRFSITNGPYGLIRIDATAITTTGARVIIVGWEMQGVA